MMFYSDLIPITGNIRWFETIIYNSFQFLGDAHRNIGATLRLEYHNALAGSASGCAVAAGEGTLDTSNPG